MSLHDHLGSNHTVCLPIMKGLKQRTVRSLLLGGIPVHPDRSYLRKQPAHLLLHPFRTDAVAADQL